MFKFKTERKENAAVSWMKNGNDKSKPYEDRYRLLSRDIPLVGKSGRGEIFAVLDGIGSAPMGMTSAQAIADCLLDFYRKPEQVDSDARGLLNLLHDTNLSINGWGYIEGTNRPLGVCVGTIAWIHDMWLTILHAGDTAGILIREGHSPQLMTGLHEFDGGISNYFGLGTKLNIDVKSKQLEPCDLVLLLSDGVTKVFSTSHAAHLVQETFDKTGDIGLAAQALVIQSREKGSLDDITALLIEVLAE